MIWANPWAWLGLAAIAVPVLVHLLTRQVSAAVPFPTLRFLRATAIVDLRRRRLSDLLLLLVRIAIVAAAVAALAQPFIPTAATAALNRIVIVDATNSTRLNFPGSETATDDFTIERRDLRAAVVEAAAWLGARAGRDELVVVSDFQHGAWDAAALAPLPSTTGVRLERVARREPVDADIAGVDRWSIDGARTRAAWGAGPAAPQAIGIEGAPGDARVAEAIADAAAATADGVSGALRPVTFVLASSPRRAALRAASSPADAPWMLDLYDAVAPAAETVRVVDGRAAVFLTSSDFAVAADAVRAALPVLALGPPLSELEPLAMTDDELRAMEREAAPAPVTEQPSAWAGRWFWIAALLLLGIEGVMRRARGGAAAAEYAHAA